MNTGVSVYGSTHFTNFKTEGGIFKGLLHLSTREKPEISAILSRATVTISGRQLFESLLTRFDLLLVTIQDFKSFIFTSGNILLPPRRRASGSCVFDKKVAAPYFGT